MNCETKNAIRAELNASGLDTPTKPTNAHLQNSVLGWGHLACVSNYSTRVPMILVLLIVIYMLTLEFSTKSKAQSVTIDVVSISTTLSTVEENGFLVATINEGESIPISVTLTGPDRTALGGSIKFSTTNVNLNTSGNNSVNLTEEEDVYRKPYLALGSGNVRTVSFSVETLINSTDITAGEITISVIDENILDPDPDQKKSQLKVKVNNVVPRVVSISKPATPTEIDEGGDFQVTLTSTPAPTTAEGDLPVTIMAADSDIGYFKSFSPNPIMIGTSGMATATVSTNILPTTNPTTALTLEVGSDTTNTDINKRFVASTSDGSESINIENVALTTVSISKSSTLTSINEGESFEIMLTATPAPTTALPVTLTTSDNDGYFNRFDPSQIMIPTTGELTVRVYTNVLPATTPSLTFRVSVGSDLTNTDTNLRYGPATGSGFVDVGIINSNKPVVQITSTANESSVVESTAFTFTLMVTPPPATNDVFPVTLALNPTTVTPPPPPTPYLDANFKLTYEIDSTGMLDVTVPTNLVDPDTSGDTIELEIVENTVLYLIQHDYEKIAFGITKIANADKSVISITSDSDDRSIGKGKGFMFKLTANQAPTANLEVNLTINDDSDFIEPDLTSPFTIPTSGMLDVDVMTIINESSDEGGEIEISIAEHSNYYISGKENQINITVQNISAVVSISAGDGPHAEGSPIILTVTSSEPPANPATINIEVSEMDGDDILASSPRTFQVELTSAKTTETVSIRTQKNGVHMHGGNLTATVTTTSTDVILAQGEISISVEDSDNPPSISISTEATSVTEGGTGAEITLTAANSVSNIELPITLEINDGDHNFFANANPGPVVVNLPARMESVTHTITPQDDTVAERPGEFTVEVTSETTNTNYTVADSPNHIISLRFIDDDIDNLPQLSVTAIEAEITEAGDDEDDDIVNASIKIAVNPATTTSLTVHYEVIVLGNYLQDQANNIGEKTEMITFNNGEYTVNLPVENDMVPESRGNITFKLISETENLTYQITAGMDTAEISVLDDDGGEELPKINISAEDSVVEGEKIIFTLTADSNATIPAAGLTIFVSITQTGNYLTNNTDENREVRLPIAGTTTLIEPTSWLDESIRNGMVIAEIQSEPLASSETPHTYSIGTEFRVAVDVQVYRGPIVSVTPPNAPIAAGTSAIFNINTTVTPAESDLMVSIRVTQERDVILWRVPNVVIIPIDESSIDLEIPTRNIEFTGDNDAITVFIQASESSDYRVRADTEATVMVTSSITAVSGPRISVADVAVNAILNLNLGGTELGEPIAFEESSQPIVSIQALNPIVLEGQSAQFLIGMQVISSSDLVVNININGGQSFVNLTSPNQQVAISRGQSNTLYTLATIDDERAEEDETLTVSIAEGEGYSIADSPLNQGSVSISDANDRAEYNQSLSAANRILIPELMATTGIQSYQTISNRVQLAFNNEEQFLFEVGGQSNPTQILQLSGQTLNNQNDLLDLLRDDTEIAIRLTSDNSILNNTTAWLKSEIQNIYNLTNTDTNSWNGEFYTGNFGIDTQLDSGLLLGIATSMAENEISYTATSDQALEYTASYTGFNPYIALNSPTLNTQVWLSSNVSSGYIDVDSQHQRTHRLNSNYSTIAFGGESRLLSFDDLPFNGSSEFNLTGQGWLGQQHIFGDGRFTSDFSTKGHHVQISLTGNHKIDVAEIGTFNPNGLIGIRDAKKDADTVTGVEFGLGALYSNNFGLTLEGFGRGFKGSEQQDYATTFTSTLTYNPNHDNTGSQLTISPIWGQSTGQTQLSLWQSNLNRENELFDHYTNGLQISSEYSYGIDLLDGIGVLIPYSAINYSKSDFMSFDIGNRIEIGTDSSFAIKGTREVRNNNITTNKVQLQGTVRW